MILADTNILLRLAQPGDPHRQPARDAIDLLTARDGESIAIAPQNLYEMYVVCSRPINANGFGMTSQQARAEITSARSLFPLLLETAQVYTTWERLIGQYAIHGKRAHDARLVAMMIEHHVPRLLTFNDDDFRQFAEIITLNPFDVVGVPRSTR
ncbi:MAG: type II toxin-antitoxin system VapC family toxin [Thermoguttaceae bacterium]